jgi:hypothetical protein
MLPITEVLGFITTRIRDIYCRPQMFAVSAESLDLILHYYHELWSMILGRHEEYFTIKMQVSCTEEHEAFSFAKNYAIRLPASTESERMEYSVRRWQEIDTLLKLEKITE